MSRGRREVLRSLTTLLVLGSITMRLLVFSLLTNTSPVSLANPAEDRPATHAAMQSGADNRRRMGTGDPLLLAKAIAPSVRLIQAAGQASPPYLPPLAGRGGDAARNANPPRIGRVDGRSLPQRSYGARPVVGQS